MGEFAPAGSNARMTQAQVRKYIKDMKEAQQIAKAKLEKAKNSGEMEKDKKELEELENIIDEL